MYIIIIIIVKTTKRIIHTQHTKKNWAHFKQEEKETHWEEICAWRENKEKKYALVKIYDGIEHF